MILTSTDYSQMGETGSEECNVLSEALCRYINNDSYTAVLIIWTAIQLTWVTMLLFVQSIQIARAMTTYENMRGAHHHHSKASEAITSALAAGTSSFAGAQLGPDGRGPDPAVPHAHGHKHHHHDGCFAQWKRILGVDTFVETALHPQKGKAKKGNPFSRGCVQNCKDFWCDPSPVFGSRENGEAMLDGVRINYTSMYEPPSRMRMRASASTRNGDGYERVGGDVNAV